MISSEIADAFRPYLQTGERIVWTGRPAQGIRFSARDIFLIPFSLLWGGIAIAVFAGSIFGGLQTASPEGGTAAILPFVLFGGVFAVVGVYVVFGRFFADAWVRSRIVYALTDRRALVLRRMFGERLSAVSLAHSPGLSLSLRGKRGDVDFEPRSMFRGFSMWMPSMDAGTRFIGIEDAAEVFRLAQQGSGQA
jgi:hypothetical protein